MPTPPYLTKIFTIVKMMTASLKIVIRNLKVTMVIVVMMMVNDGDDGDDGVRCLWFF